MDVRNIFAGSHTEHCWRCSLKVFYRGKYHVTRNTFIVSHDLDNCVKVLVTLLQKIRDYPMPLIQEAVEGLQIYGRLESE
jgi:hypothetical protein